MSGAGSSAAAALIVISISTGAHRTRNFIDTPWLLVSGIRAA
jgi:hypothetical protein